MYKGENRRKNILDAKGRKFTLAYCVFIVSTIFYLAAPFVLLAIGRIPGEVYENLAEDYGLLIVANIFTFVTGNVLNKKVQNGRNYDHEEGR